jgi:iron(III) transport system substrate-binding protein
VKSTGEFDKEGTMKRMIAAILGVLFIAAMVSPAGAQSEWDRVLAAAKKEGVVAVAGAPGNTHREALGDAFAKAYPDIKVEYNGMSGRDGVPRIVRERQANLFNWDIYIGGPTSALGGLKPLGAFDPLRPALVRPELVDDSKWHNGFQDGFMDLEGRLFYAFDGTVTQVVHANREFIPKGEILSSKELLDPKWAGKIVWEDPRHEGAGLNAGLIFMLSYGEDFLRKLLREQKIVYTRDRRQMTEWAVRGRHPIVIAMPTDELIIFQEKGVGKQVEPRGPIRSIP